MNIVTIVRLCLSIVSALMRRANEKQHQEIGADRVIKSNMVNILTQVKTGKRIDAESEHYSDDDVDRILQSHFRD